MSGTAPKNLPRLLRLVALAVVTTGLMVGLSGPAHAALLLAEPFDYPDGDLNGNNGGSGFGGSQWTTAWSGSAYFDVGSGVVHSITGGAGGQSIERHFSLNEPSGTTVYMSALMTQPQSESWYNVSLGINDINTAFLAMTDKVFRTKLNGTAVTGGNVEVGRPYRIVTRLEFDVDGAGNERMTLWVDPASESDPHLLQVTKDTGAGSPGGRTNIYSDGANTTFLVDDVRFATAFEDVISGPITLYRDVVMADSPHAYYRLNLYNPGSPGPVPDWATADGAQDAVILGINNTQDGQPGIPGAYDTSVLMNQTGSNRDDYVVHKVGMSDPLTMVDDTVNDYTIEAWFKTAVVDGNLGGIAGFTSNVDGSEPYAALWRNGDDVWFYVRDDNANVIANLNSNATQDGLVTADIWHHVVGVKDATTYSLYLDGELVDSTTLGSISGSFNRNRFQIGNMNNGTDHTYFPLEEAFVDEVAVYLYALHGDDVLWHYLYGANLVPEPSTLALSCLGMFCLIGCCRRRRKRAG